MLEVPEAPQASPELVCAFTGRVHSPQEVGTFWSVADEEAFQQAGATRVLLLADQISRGSSPAGGAPFVSSGPLQK